MLYISSFSSEGICSEVHGLGTVGCRKKTIREQTLGRNKVHSHVIAELKRIFSFIQSVFSPMYDIFCTPHWQSISSCLNTVGAGTRSRSGDSAVHPQMAASLGHICYSEPKSASAAPSTPAFGDKNTNLLLTCMAAI